MSLIKNTLTRKKNLNKQEEQTFVRGDIRIFAEVMLEDEILAEKDKLAQKDYVLVGYFNDDKTKFKDIVTGQVHGMSANEVALMHSQTNRTFTRVYAVERNCKGTVEQDLSPHHKHVKSFYPLNYERLLLYVLLDVYQDFIYEFFKTSKDKLISKKDIARLKDMLNNHVRKNVQNKIKSIEETTEARKTYDTNF